MENGQTLKRPVEATCPGRGCERQKALQLQTLLSEGDGLDRCIWRPKRDRCALTGGQLGGDWRTAKTEM